MMWCDRVACWSVSSVIVCHDDVVCVCIRVVKTARLFNRLTVRKKTR